MLKSIIPNPVIAVVGEILGNHYYSHSRLNTLFMESGAPGDPPEGNCVHKCQQWLRHCNANPDIDAFAVLGKVLGNFMEVDIAGPGYGQKIWLEERDRIRNILAKYSLSYHQGGQVLGCVTGVPSRSLREILEKHDLIAVNEEFQRCVESAESDPPAGITAACSIIESLCKIYIEDECLKMPAKQDIKSLWKAISINLGLEPGKIEDQDIIRIFSGFISVVDGIGSLRTHTSTAHGHGRKAYRLEPRHARLAIHAAYTLVCFILETWEARRCQKN